MFRKLVLSALIVAAVVLSAIPAALGWTVEDCIEVDYDHPDCDQYPTTTTENNPCDEYHETRHPECQTTTTSTPPTTTTTQPEVTTTTQGTTTTVFTQQTTTTVQECVPPLVHQPPFCVPPPGEPTVPTPQIVTPPTTPEGEEQLPFTGDWTQLLALIGGSAGVSGAYLIRRAKDKRDD